MSTFDFGPVIIGVVLFVVWPLSIWWFVRLERRRPPMTATGDGGYGVECVHCEGLGAQPSRTGPVICTACGGTGTAE